MDCVRRKRSVILNADVVGYSRMMAADDLAALDRLLTSMRRVIGAVTRAGGRVVDATGDNLMAELPSETAALRCALEVQHALAERNQDRDEPDQLHLRIGLHSGELLTRNGRLYGDVVNTAARLQAAAAPDGILISAAVAEHLEAALEHLLEDLGPHRYKNLPTRIQTFGVRV
jgi:class 3 adenylate cyclase